MKNSLPRTLLLFALSIFISASAASAQSMFEKINDFDGDGHADFAITRGEGSQLIWHVWQTTAGYRRVHWGLSSDNEVAGDYDGDGRTDFAVARLSLSFPVTLDYYILSSQSGTMSLKQVSSTAGPQWFQWQQDFDGDGKTDPGLAMGEASRIVYRSSMTDSIDQFLFPGGAPLRIGDTDGDNRSENAAFNPSTHVVTIVESASGATRTVHFGIQNDRYLPADFDGDGKGDLTIWRRSTGDWWWIRSSDSVVNVLHWGVDGDIAVPADYDGDGKTDHAVYRRAVPNSIYYVRGSQSGFQAFVWGVQEDLPVVY